MATFFDKLKQTLKQTFPGAVPQQGRARVRHQPPPQPPIQEVDRREATPEERAAWVPDKANGWSPNPAKSQDPLDPRPKTASYVHRLWSYDPTYGWYPDPPCGWKPDAAYGWHPDVSKSIDPFDPRRPDFRARSIRRHLGLPEPPITRLVPIDHYRY